MHHMYHGYGILGWFMGSIHMLIPIIGIYLIFSFFSKRWDRGYTFESNRSLDLLRERYIRGEITRDEFLEIKKDIRG